MFCVKWDLTDISTMKFETNSYDIDDNFSNISIQTDTADIKFVPTQDDISNVKCYEMENKKHLVSVVDNTLVIEADDQKKWYEYLNFTSNKPKVTVYLPQREYAALYIKSSTGDIEIPQEYKYSLVDITDSTGNVQFSSSVKDRIKIGASTGDILVDNISVGEMDLSVSTGKNTCTGIISDASIQIKVSTGKASLTDVKCTNVISTGNTGDIYLEKVVATESFSIVRSTGHVRFNGCYAQYINVKTDTGDVSGTLLTPKVFTSQTSTGKVKVPSSIEGGKCEIKTSTGDIKIEIG